MSRNHWLRRLDDILYRVGLMETEWENMYGMRNIIAHAYDIVLPSVLFFSAVNELNHLKKVINEIKAKHI